MKKLLFLSSLLFLAFQQACTSDEQALQTPVAAGDNFEVTAPTGDKANAFAPVYFTFDSSVLSTESSSSVLSISEFMKQNPAQSLRVDGHCDERGTEQYNIALGMRRAEAVKKALVSEGVSEAQVSTNSFGKERPAVVGHDEEAWKMNRRAEFSISAAAAQ
jgi:peptidoglycan-associated lipoprotein